MMRTADAAAAIASVLLAACPLTSGASPIAFKEVTTAAGFTYTGSSWTVAWSDANGDALPDLFFGNHGAPRNLFLNVGNGTFRESPAGMFNKVSGDAHGAAWADFDNDGDQDLVELVGADRGTSVGKSNHLYINENGVLNNRAVERGVSDPLGRGRTPLWFDWDGDGHLDLLALNADRVDAPSVLFHNVGGYFSRTGAVDFTGFTKYAVFGSLEPGKGHLVLSGQPAPKRIYDAHQTSPLPMTDLRQALGIVPDTSMVADTVLFDVNEDGIDDILQVKGKLSSDVAIADGDVHARIVLEDAGGTRGFRFNASTPITVNVAPLWQSWWTASDIYIGRTGWHPADFPVKLSATQPGVDGLAVPSATKGIYIGFDRLKGSWEVRVVSDRRQEANFIIDGGVVSGVQPVGFQRFARRNATLLVSHTGQYVDGTANAGLADPDLASHCFSATPADFDNDGDVDVFAACSGPIGKAGIENLLLTNDGAGRFTAVPQAGGLSRSEHGIADGAAAADFDLDGFVDLALSNGQGLYPFNDGPSQLFRNTSRLVGNTNHWLEIDLRGVESNRDGVGARVRVTAGGKTQTRLQRHGVHNGSQDHPRIHFGLGASTAVASIEVEWPSGARQTLTDVPADQVLRIVEGRGATAPFELKPVNSAFGAQTIYTSGTARTIMVTNRASVGQPIKTVQLIGQDAGQFAMTHNCGQWLAAGASCRVDTWFKPTATGAKAAQLLVVAGDQFVETANLAGSGIQAVFALTPTRLDFGNVRVGALGAAQNVVVKNTGASVLPVRWVGLEGANRSQFVTSNGCPQIVALGQSCTIGVTFKPSSKGASSALLVVSPGKSGTAKSVPLSGNGA